MWKWKFNNIAQILIYVLHIYFNEEEDAICNYRLPVSISRSGDSALALD